MSAIIQRVIVGIAVLISAGALGYVVYRVTCSDCGKQRPLIEPSSDLSAEGNSRLDRIVNTISRVDTLTHEDALYLEESVLESDEIYVQRWALVVMAEHLGPNTTKMTAETRKLLEGNIVRELSSTNHRMAICAIASAEQAGLTARPDVRDMIVSLRDSGDPRVAARATRSPLPGEAPKTPSQTERWPEGG